MNVNVFAQILTLIDRQELDAAEALMAQTGLDRDTAPQALYVQGLVAYARGDHRGAKVKFSRAAKAAPGFTPPLIALGNAALALGEHEPALKAYKAALALEPQNPAILGNIGAVESVMGDFDAAEATLTKALALAPNNPPVLANLAQIHRQRGDFAKALTCVELMGEDPNAATLKASIEAAQAAAPSA